MQEKELRLALVCFGGVSLAIYMHGVTKEILKLVRASQAYHALPKGAARDQAKFADRIRPGDTEYDSEHAYFELLQELGKQVDLRVVVDVVSGASAGGINGIILARALAHDLRIDHFRNLWLHEADVSRLLDPKKKAGQFSKFYMRPLLWLAARTKLGRVLLDPEIREKLSLFTRSRWFEPPFDGQHLGRQLLAGLEAMGDPRKPGASLMPTQLALDLFVTLTDFYGYLRHIPIHDPPFVQDREHRHLLRFTYRRWPNGEEQSDFTRADAPALAFAGRATSAFPGAFPPAQIGDIEQLMNEQGRTWETKDAFLARNFPDYFRAELDPEKTSFVDGGVLANKPFAAAMRAIRGRPAYRQVDRRLVYIDPQPMRPAPPPTGRVPGFFRVLKGALSDIPRNEPIADELIAVARFNERVRHLRDIIEATQPQVTRLVEESAPHNIESALSELEIRLWRMQASERAVQEAGFAYEGYVRLKLGAVLDAVHRMVCTACGFGIQSAEAQWTRHALLRWAEDRGVSHTATHFEHARPGASPDQLPPWARFLLRFDTSFRQRRLRFLIQRLNQLYGKLGDPEHRALRPEQIDDLKHKLYDAQEDLRRLDGGNGIAPATADMIRQLFFRRVEPQQAVQLAADAAAFAEANMAAIDHVIDRLAEDIALNRNTGQLDALFAGLEPTEWSAAARRDLLVSYIGFPFWDVLTFTITNWRDLGEFNEIRIDRISPEDAVAIRRGNTLKGVHLGRFGGFFSRAHRENDYLWGRLHAVDRLIDIVYDAALGHGTESTVNRKAIKLKAFRLVLDREAANLAVSRGLIEDLRRELDAIAAGTA
ncbi:MAG TPA: patatin-like protein [Ferrovibrio sp.]|uniref:patatin-like protein n=1 Tax=Ferrovibrio sp. TaxID=1917215 RepID=UPI002B4AC77D|nr:patatin-like protein [Ferrovibrio sp.]HLT76433.1 patatin-like protein [Ferrovibrio sp.]